MKTEYKGITITENKQGMFLTLDKEYGSMAAAKGAVTRWVNANVEAVQKQEEATAITSHSGVVISADAVKQMQDALLPAAVKFTSAKNDKGDPIAANPKTAQVYAELDYFGMEKARDTRSRNKREGKYAGKRGFHMIKHVSRHIRTGPKDSGCPALK